MTNIYKENILAHYKNPKNFGSLKKPDISGDYNNPLCGDSIIIQMNIDSKKIKDVRFIGKGCAISIASSSILLEFLKGKKLSILKDINKKFMEKLINVKISEGREKCLLLPINTINKILQK